MEDFYKKVFYVSIGFTIVSIYVFVVLGSNVSNNYYFGFVIPSISLIIGIIFYFKYKTKKSIREVKENYGVHKDIKKKKETKGSLFIIKKEKAEYYIDEQSFKDLNLSSIFKKIDNTFTTMGEEVLYSILRLPLFNMEEIKEREGYIKLFEEDSNTRENISYRLNEIGKFRKGNLVKFLYGDMPKQSSLRFLVYFMFYLTLGSIVLIATNPSYIFYMVVLFIINYSIHGFIKNKVFDNIEAIRDLSYLVNVANKLTQIDNDKLPILKDLKELNKNCKKLSKKSSMLGSVEGVDIISDYFKILFLVEERGYFKSVGNIISNIENLKKIYDIVGTVDAYISIASYRKYVGDYCIPIFSSKKSFFDIKECYHPLVNKPVKNDIMIDNNGIILTGSNMSGKSTFLKTIGVNALFSQTIVTVLSSYYEGSLFKVISSISPEDSILEGKSYYLAEAEALLRITKLADRGSLLCLIDEIFRGTNPLERISSSAEILDYIANHGGVPIVATHDIELTNITNHPFNLFYFKEDVGENGLTFDYKIRAGVSNTQNAIKLLEFLGYPEVITKNAYLRVAKGEIK